MHIIVAVDDRGGMMFNHRRLSQDSLLRQRILTLTRGSRLLMNEYTARQFAPEEIDPDSVMPDHLECAAAGDFCFVEDQPLAAHLPQIERVYLYKWNRSYPADQWLDLPLAEWTLLSSDDFPGSSHEKITEEIYVK